MLSSYINHGLKDDSQHNTHTKQNYQYDSKYTVQNQLVGHCDDSNTSIHCAYIDEGGHSGTSSSINENNNSDGYAYSGATEHCSNSDCRYYNNEVVKDILCGNTHCSDSCTSIHAAFGDDSETGLGRSASTSNVWKLYTNWYNNMNVMKFISIITMIFVCCISTVSTQLVSTVGTYATPTGTTVEYTLVLAYDYSSVRPIRTINGQSPGPVIECNVGDTLSILVINHMNDSTAIHWHGQLQHGSTVMDGVAGITQCPLPPGTSMTYTFTAQPAGTYWYHAHYMDQYSDGLYGPLIIHEVNGDPYSTEYTDTWILQMADWYNKPAMELKAWYLSTDNPDGVDPIPDAITVNGAFSNTVVYNATQNQSVLLRLINAAAFSMYNFSVDGVLLIVTQMDGNDVQPYTVPYIILNVAQRANVIVNFTALDSTIGNVNSIYFRVQAMLSMYDVDVLTYTPPYETQPYPYQQVHYNPLYLGIIQLDPVGTMHNDTAPVVYPTYSTAPYYAEPRFNSNITFSTPFVVADINNLDARPMVIQSNIPTPTYNIDMTVTFVTNDAGINVAQFNGVSWPTEQNTGFNTIPPMLTQYSTQSKLAVSNINYQQTTNTVNQFFVPNNGVVEMTIWNSDNGEHPFHMHGHNFWVIATSANPQAESLYVNNYVVRDTISVPAGVQDAAGNVLSQGWAKIRFVANNPGTWLFHCHIEWHMDAGLVALMIEAPEVLLQRTLTSDVMTVCNAQNSYLTELAAIAAAADGIQVYQFTPMSIGLAMLSNCIIVSESLYAYLIYRLGVLPSILLEVLAFMIGTLLGATFIELIPDIYTAVFVEETLSFEICTFLILFGIGVSYTIEKFIKRGRGNKFQQLIKMYTAQGKLHFDNGTNQRDSHENDALVSNNLNESLINSTASRSGNNSGVDTVITDQTILQRNTSVNMSEIGLLNGRSSSEISTISTDVEQPPVSSHDSTLHTPTLATVDELTDKGTVVELSQTPSTSVDGPEHVQIETDSPAVQLQTLEKLDIMNEERRLALGTDTSTILVMLLGDMMHNFCDGATIASAWLVSNSTGIAATIGIFMEELPHLVGMFAVFVAAGASIKKGILLNVLGASPFLLGGALVLGIASIPNVDIDKIQYLIAFAIGTFIYIMFTDLLPVLTMNWQGTRRAVIQILVCGAGIGVQAGVNVYNASQGV